MSAYVFAGPRKEDSRRGHIIVGLQTQEATSIVSYCCSKRVIPIPTSYLTARRSASPILQCTPHILLHTTLHGCGPCRCSRAHFPLSDILRETGKLTRVDLCRISRNIQYPVLTYVSQMLLNFRSRAQGYLMSFSRLNVSICPSPTKYSCTYASSTKNRIHLIVRDRAGLLKCLAQSKLCFTL